MKRTSLLTLAIAGMLLLPVMASAQTSSGTLTISATVQSSISMYFTTNGSGVSLTGSGTNAATLAFGNISAYGTLAANVSRSVGATNFTVSTPFDVSVEKSNSSSANFSLTAQLGSADATNTWALGATTITNGSAATVAATGSYGAAGSAYTLNLTVPLAASAGAIGNTINFVATAN